MSEDIFSEDDLLAITGTDAEMRRDLRDIYVSERERLVAELHRAIARREAAAIADAAHAVKSLSASVGGRAAFALAGQMEALARRGDHAPASTLATPLCSSLAALQDALTAYVEKETRAC